MPPLYDDAEDKVKTNLTIIAQGGKAPVQTIGELTKEQHEGINAIRDAEGLPLLENPEVLYMGRHHFNSRKKDGYTIDDMYKQVESAMSANAIATASTKMTGIQNPHAREDGYGSQVHDLGILELTSKKPRAELFSVIPKGDVPPKKKV